MQIKLKTLEQALTTVKPGLADKDIIEQATSFAFMNGGVVTYNDEISFSYPIEGLEIEGAILAEELYQFLKRVKKDEIEIETKGGEIHFKSGRVKAGFTLQTEILLPLKEIREKGKWFKIPDDFCHYLYKAMGAAGSDMSEPILTGVYVEKSGLMVSSDNYRGMICETGQELPIKTFLVPATSAAEIVKIKPNKIAESEGWIHFLNEDGATLSCRIFGDTYPKERIMGVEVEGPEIELPPIITDALERAEIFAKRSHFLDESIDVIISSKRIKVKAKSETGWIEEELNMKYEGEEAIFSITPYLLKDILKETKTFILGERALKFEGAGWTYITALRNAS